MAWVSAESTLLCQTDASVVHRAALTGNVDIRRGH